MIKFLAVVKREYLQRVRSKLFIIATILGPLVMSLFGVVPALIFSIKTGEPVRLAVVDQTDRIYPRFYRMIQTEGELKEGAVNANALSPNGGEGKSQPQIRQEASFQLEEIKSEGRSIEDIRKQLDERIRQKKLDGYLVLPVDLLSAGKAEFFGRNTGDVFTREHLENELSAAVRETRLEEANIDARKVRDLSRPVDLQSFKIGAGAAEHDSGEGFILVFGAGFVIYLTVLMYGQVVLGAVIEEKETRIAEILFSSIKPFSLMMGKLIGVSLLALTQLACWAVAFLILAQYGMGVLAGKGLEVTIPRVPPIMFLYFALFFLLGYFIYATIYALIGSMVTTAQEGGQLAVPIILLLVVGLYLAFPVIQSPDSSFAFWVSMFPFFAPITMLVRIVTQTPSFLQILLSLIIGFGTVLLLTWLAARIYRVGMLMYGKRATIPEVWRWVRQP